MGSLRKLDNDDFADALLSATVAIANLLESAVDQNALIECISACFVNDETEQRSKTTSLRILGKYS